jgi:hypothetical protein
MAVMLTFLRTLHAYTGREGDLALTPLGNAKRWPQALKATKRLMLNRSRSRSIRTTILAIIVFSRSALPSSGRQASRMARTGGCASLQLLRSAFEKAMADPELISTAQRLSLDPRNPMRGAQTALVFTSPAMAFI